MRSQSWPAKGQVCILVVEFNQLNSHVLASALRRRSGFQVHTAAPALDDCLELLRSHPAQVVLIGTAGTNKNADLLGLLRDLSLHHPHLGIVLMSDDDDPNFVAEAFRCGARGLIGASNSFRVLCHCIMSVHKGEYWLSSHQLGVIMERFRQAAPLRVLNTSAAAHLTTREEAIVRLVAEGMTNREVSLRLRMTENSVKKSICKIFEKLGISNRVELALSVVASTVSSDRPGFLRTSA